MGYDISDKTEPGTIVSVVEMEEGGHDASSSRRRRLKGCASILRRSFTRNSAELSPWPTLVRRTLYFLLAALGLATITSIVFHALLINLVRRLSPPNLPSSGLDKVVLSWLESSNGTSPAWLPNFSRGIIPKPIHSHNDYWRAVPLFEALSLGLTGVEADCHLVNEQLYVGHSDHSLRQSRTFRSLYLDPLLTILENQNGPENLISDSNNNGVWDVDPSRTLVLMTDLKTDGISTLEAVQKQLAPFRERGWLTHWNGTGIVPGVITHVGTGNTPFTSVLNSSYSNSTYRDVFFDAPLHALSDAYNISNSYYASTALAHQFGGKGKIPHTGLTKQQMITVKAQIERAASLGLVSRYWDIPGWPVNRRMNVWNQLEELDIGMLNVDEVEEAARWNWRWCNVLGLHLC